MTTIDACPNIDFGGDVQPPEISDNHDDALTSAVDSGRLDNVADPTAGKDTTELASGPEVRGFRDLGTDEAGEPPIEPWSEFGDKGGATPVRPFSEHLTDDGYSGEIVPFGEHPEADAAAAQSLGHQAVERAAEVVSTAGDGVVIPSIDVDEAGTPDEEEGTDFFSKDGGENRIFGNTGVTGPKTSGMTTEGHAAEIARYEALEARAQHNPVAAAWFRFSGAAGYLADERSGATIFHSSTAATEATGGGAGDEDRPVLGAGADANPQEIADPELQTGGGDHGGRNDPPGGSGGDVVGPEPGDPGEEDPEDKAQVVEASEAAAVRPADRPVIPRQQVEEERALARGDTPEKAEPSEAEIAEAVQQRDEAHAANVADLVHLASISRVEVAAGGRYDNLRFVLGHNHQDATEYLAELAADLRSGSTEVPRLTNWREELTGPDKLQPGQIIEVATMKELDELLARVGGWLNNDIRATRGSGALSEPHKGVWQDNKPRPSELLGVVDLRGKHFFGQQTNIEAMPLPAMRGHSDKELSRYFTVSSQLKSTGKPPEPSRPMRLVSVSALRMGYQGDKITSRYAEIGHVPAAVSAWLLDSQSRQTAHDVAYDNAGHPILSGRVGGR